MLKVTGISTTKSVICPHSMQNIKFMNKKPATKMTDIWDTAFGPRLKNLQCFGEYICLQVQSTEEEPILVDPLDRGTV
jgi:hypothetical protein